MATADTLNGVTEPFSIDPRTHYHSASTDRCSKRQKTSSIPKFSDPQLHNLRWTASIFGIPVENLLAFGYNCLNNSSPYNPDNFVPQTPQPENLNGLLTSHLPHNVGPPITVYAAAEHAPIDSDLAHTLPMSRKRTISQSRLEDINLFSASDLNYSTVASSSCGSDSDQVWNDNFGFGFDAEGIPTSSTYDQRINESDLDFGSRQLLSHSSASSIALVAQPLPSTPFTNDWSSYSTTDTPPRPDSVGTVCTELPKPVVSLCDTNYANESKRERARPKLGARVKHDPAKAPRKGRGPFRDLLQRKETELTRKMGACIRCSLKRVRCNPDPSNSTGGCLTCSGNPRLRFRQLPCLRYKIDDTLLLAHDVCPRATWTSRWKSMDVVDIQEWDSTAVETIRITQDVARTGYSLQVRRFRPLESDALSRKWKTNGVEQSYQCEPYAIADMKAAGQTLQSFADNTLKLAIDEYIAHSDDLVRDTYLMAYKQTLEAESEEERLLLGAVFRLWAASRMESRSERICGKQTLGMKPGYYGPGCSNNRKVLTPPVMSAQIEVIMTSLILQPARKEVLKRLRKLLEGKKRRSWFTLYLALFILLHNCALLTKADKKRALKQGQIGKFFRPRLIEGLHEGAKILLAHFHISQKEHHPFLVDWSSQFHIEHAELNEEQARFMLETVNEINRRGGPAKFSQDLRDSADLENEYFFLAQLFDPDWKPNHI